MYWWVMIHRSLWSDREGYGRVREVMEEMICQRPWWEKFYCPCVCQDQLPLTPAPPKHLWGSPQMILARGSKATDCVQAYAYVCVWTCLLPHVEYTLSPDYCVHQCRPIYNCLLYMHFMCVCACVHVWVSESDSRWTKDVQWSKGPAGSHCTEYSFISSSAIPFKATCSSAIFIRATI